MSLKHRLANLFDPFERADDAPPRTLWAFCLWALRGAWPVMILAALLSAAAGATEVLTALILGWVVDAATAGTPGAFFGENLLLIALFLGFYLAARPLLFGLSATFSGLVVTPQIQTMAQQRLHRWTLGHSLSFFTDDFAGRIAQKQMQTATALTNVAVEVINVGFFALASLIGTALLLITIDLRIAGVMVLWACAYFAMIRYFLPRIRSRSKARAGARAVASGQIVDTITNIATVKLFANHRHEDGVALDAMEVARQRMIDFG
ncbi:MAG: ABC transporter transmembrane domain-containing protein, partial [Shimia sp.]